jgi:transposase
MPQKPPCPHHSRNHLGQCQHQRIRRHRRRSRLVLAIRGIDQDLADDKCHLTDLVSHLAPQLLAKRGVGPVTAAQAIVSWSHPGRCRNDAAYAALAGASSRSSASSGRIVRHRLNRGGDRHINRTCTTSSCLAGAPASEPGPTCTAPRTREPYRSLNTAMAT